MEKYRKVDNLVVKITYFVALSILAVLVVWGGYRLIYLWNYEETNDAQVKAYINPVLSRGSGYVTDIRYVDHQKVFKGDTLLVLDQQEVKVHLQEAYAALDMARAQLEVLKSNVKTAKGNVNVNVANLDAAKAQLWRAQQAYQRYHKLYQEEAVTKQQFEDVETKLRVAEADTKAVENNYMVAKNKTNDVVSQLSVAKAAVKQRLAAVDRLKLELGYTVIMSPTDGYLGKKQIQVGQFIQKGQTVAFMINQDQGKWIEANFEETQIASMDIGQEAEIKIDAYPDHTFHGKIVSLSPATGAQFSLLPPDNATGNFVKVTQRFPVRIEFTDGVEQIERLKAGMNAEVSVHKL